MSNWEEKTILKCKWHGDESEAFHIVKEIGGRFAVEPRQKNFGSKQYVCPICLSLLDEVTDKVCPSCGEEMAWDKIKDGENK